MEFDVPIYMERDREPRALAIHSRFVRFEYMYMHMYVLVYRCTYTPSFWSLMRGGGLGSRPKKIYGERLGDGVEYHLMSPTPRR